MGGVTNSTSRSSCIGAENPASDVLEDIVPESPLILVLSSLRFDFRRLTILCFRFRGLPVLELIADPLNEDPKRYRLGRVEYDPSSDSISLVPWKFASIELVLDKAGENRPVRSGEPDHARYTTFCMLGVKSESVR